MNAPSPRPPEPPGVPAPSRLGELAGLFLRLGATAFGGPAAHIALVEAEVVRRREWISRERFLEMLALANLLPGPNSTELVLFVGRERAGFPGMVVAGLSFILPAALIVGTIAAVYVSTRTLPPVQDLLAGILPVVVAILVQAIFSLSRTALRTPILALVAATTLGFAFIPHVGTLGLLVAAGAFVAAHEASLSQRRFADATVALLTGVIALVAAVAAPVIGFVAPPTPTMPPSPLPAPAGPPVTPLALFLVFLKIGSVLFGSGWVLVAWLQAELVSARGWLDARTLLDAVSVGQITPGPLFTTATFIGAILAGVPGAIAATVGIFLPAFVLVAVSARIEAFLAAGPSTRAFVDGVAAASLGLMGHAALSLAGTALRWPWTLAAAVIALVLLVRFRTPPLVLMGAGAVAGLVWGMLRT